jgi:hypothetical protein
MLDRYRVSHDLRASLATKLNPPGQAREASTQAIERERPNEGGDNNGMKKDEGQSTKCRRLPTKDDEVIVLD